MELSPECPVCLQPYDEQTTVPRVLACGHSTCEQCLVALPPPRPALPDALRCPACTQVVPFPRSVGPAALPKNIDLLRLLPSSSSRIHPSSHSDAESRPSAAPEFFPLSADQRRLYSTWKDFILPQDAISSLSSAGGVATDGLWTATAPSHLCRHWFSRANQLVSLLPIALVSPSSRQTSWFCYSYTARLVEALHELEDRTRDELRFLVESSWKGRRGLCKIYGLWMNTEEDSSHLYMVSETFDRKFSNVLENERKRSTCIEIADKFLPFARIGLDLCEAVMVLHSEGIICGCLTTSCICFDGFGHCLIDLNKILLTCGRIWEIISSYASGREVDAAAVVNYQVYVSPETFLGLYDEDASGSCGLQGTGYGSDVWSLACILIILLTGDELLVPEVVDGWIAIIGKGMREIFVESYASWKEKVVSKLESFLMGTHFEPMLNVLALCLSYDLHNRPSVYDVWHSIEIAAIKCFSLCSPLDGFQAKDTPLHCLVLGRSFPFSRHTSTVSSVEVNLNICNASVAEMLERNECDNKHPRQDINDGDLTSRIHGVDSHPVILQGHNDCVTGLAVGGGFLFSSSFDKTINVWSLQDFSHIQCLKGHEHRVMAILVVNGTNERLCVSGDSGSGIFLWSIGESVGQEPCKKWYEHNDWRYSGIHSLAVSGTGNLYTGSGDKSIKAWSLQDYSLSCTMFGHRSTVSSLAVANGVLYSGSWDGTIRLWWLHDHSPLAVLGAEAPGHSAPILSLSIDSDLLVSSHENGVLKLWKNDALVRSEQIQDGAIFALHINKGFIFTGGWDKIILVQALSENELEADISDIASLKCDGAITCLLYWHGKLFAGFSNKDIKGMHLLRCSSYVRINHADLQS